MTDPVPNATLSPPLPTLVPAVDIEIMALLCTRLCHDLSGPIGAIAAGTELLSDGDDDFIQETAALLSHSADSAVARLRLLRAALGILHGGTVSPVQALEEYLHAVHGTEITLDWLEKNSHVWGQGDVARVTLNMALVAIETLGGRGNISIHLAASNTIVVRATGKRCQFTPPVLSALEGNRQDISARTVQAYYLACLTAETGGLGHRSAEGWIELSSSLPSQGK